jgi:hypothetical protein
MAESTAERFFDGGIPGLVVNGPMDILHRAVILLTGNILKPGIETISGQHAIPIHHFRAFPANRTLKDCVSILRFDYAVKHFCVILYNFFHTVPRLAMTQAIPYPGDTLDP